MVLIIPSIRGQNITCDLKKKADDDADALTSSLTYHCNTSLHFPKTIIFRRLVEHMEQERSTGFRVR